MSSILHQMPEPDNHLRPELSAPINAETDAFRKAFFPTASVQDWNDWHWQMANRLTELADFEKIFSLADDERTALAAHAGQLSVALTPYYASLMSRTDAADPLRQTQIPTSREHMIRADESCDPIGEDPAMPTANLIHRYPDRIVFLTTNTCASYCRYCTRARMVSHADKNIGRTDWDQSLDYIRSHPEIRDVLISGGEPLLLGDEKLDGLLTEIRAIKHVEFMRIGTKLPVTLPQRITPKLVSILKKYHPLWISLHIIHPSELTTETKEAIARLVDAGLPIGSQTVLLKGVNDDATVMKNLMHGLLMNRVTPYALFQLDSIKGSSRFRTTIAKGLELIDSLRGHTSGYAVPSYIIDPPGGGGKVQLAPNPIVGREGDDLILRNYEGKIYRYPDPAE